MECLSLSKMEGEEGKEPLVPCFNAQVKLCSVIYLCGTQCTPQQQSQSNQLWNYCRERCDPMGVMIGRILPLEFNYSYLPDCCFQHLSYELISRNNSNYISVKKRDFQISKEQQSMCTPLHLC